MKELNINPTTNRKYHVDKAVARFLKAYKAEQIVKHFS